MSNTATYSDVDILAARHENWRKANLEWKFSPTQRRMFEFWKGVKGKTSVFNCGRRVGKTHYLCIIALTQCIKKPNSIVKFLQPEKGQVQTNVIPVMNKILEDCPPDLKPEWKTQQSKYLFPNGSEIQLGGTDKNNYEKLRGGDADLCLIDEAGFLKAPLGYIIKSVLAPSTMRTFGKILLSSSIPTDPNHEFLKYMETARLGKRFFAITTKACLEEHEKENNQLFTRAMYQSLVEEYPKGEQDEDFKRECLNQVVFDGTNAVIPEFNDELALEVVAEWKRPAYCDKYVSMDIGFKDLTVALFAFYDFDNGVTVVEDELVMSGIKMTTTALANELKVKEMKLWTNPATLELEDPYLRVCDTNLILINDLQRLHGLTFLPVQKDNKEAQINALRMELSNYKLYINPRCETLIHHLKHATWNKARTTYARSPDSGHYDAIDALIYLIRTVQKSKNPYPSGYQRYSLGPAKDIFINPGYDDNSKKYSKIKDIFTVKKRR